MSKERLDPIVINKFIEFVSGHLCLLKCIIIVLSYLINCYNQIFFTNFETNVCATEQDQRSLKVMLECFGVWMKQITPESQ